MKIIEKVAATMLLSTTFLFVFAAPVSAFVPDIEIPSESQTWTEETCSRYDNKIDRKIRRYEWHHQVQLERYQDRAGRIQNIIDEYAPRGHDVTKLRDDLRVWNEKIADFDGDYTALINKLKEAMEFTCWSSRAQMFAKLREAKGLRDIVDADMEDMSNFYFGTVKLDIAEMKKQKHITAE